MAKQGFSYYKAECDRFQDIKIKRLKKRHGCAGYAVYQYLLNEIYRVRGYFLRFTSDEEFDLAEYWALDEEVVTEIVNYCAEIGLFNNDLWKQKGILTARSIQVRYIDICKICKKNPVIEEELRLVEAPQSAPTAAPAPTLFTGSEMSPLRIVPKEVGEEPSASTPKTEDDHPLEGIGTAILAELAQEEADAVSGSFQKIPEISGNFSEESDKSIKSYVSINSSSNSPSAEEADKASPSPDKNRLRLLMKTMSIVADDARWISTIERIDADDSPLWTLAEEVRQSRGRLTVCSYLLPSLRSLVASGRLTVRRQEVDTSEELRRMLRQVKVPSYDLDRVLEAAQGQEKALREAIDEVRRSKGKINMPARYILSRLRKAAPAKAS